MVKCFIRKGSIDILKAAALGLQLYQKETLTQMFSSEYCEFFKNAYFEEHLRTAVVFEMFREKVELKAENISGKRITLKIDLVRLH